MIVIGMMALMMNILMVLVVISGETLCRDNCQLIGMSLIGLSRQVQKIAINQN